MPARRQGRPSPRDSAQQTVRAAPNAARDRLAAIGGLVAGVAHEINGPVASVASNLRFALDALRDWQRTDPDCGATLPAEITASLRDAAMGAERLLALAGEVTGMARARAADGPPFDVRETLQNALRLAAPALRATVPCVAAPRAAYVRGNSGKLCQVLINLLSNAAQAVEHLPRAQRRIEVEVISRRGVVTIRVQDNGSGISPEVLPRLFEPLFTTKGAAGTGLGLHLSRETVTELGGRIEVEGAAGVGATFTIHLPATTLARTKANKVRPGTSPPRLRG